MYQSTKNSYKFKYIQTGITGKGIPEVFLPEVGYGAYTGNEPYKPVYEILDFGDKWQKQDLPDGYEDWKDKETFENAKITKYNELQKKKMERGEEYQPPQEEYIHPKMEDFKMQEWIRRWHGVWIYLMIGGVKTPVYITGLHYFLLQWWPVPFEVSYRDTDREIGYWIQYWEEDPRSVGGILGMMRQYGKSVWLGVWGFERTSRMRNAHLGMQGVNDKAIKTFYETHILYPFDRLIDFFTPQYYQSGQNKESLEFIATKKRNKRLTADEMNTAINSKIDFGIADINRYVGKTLTGYIGEEPGSVVDVACYPRHRKVVPAMRARKGKMFYASTSDEVSPKAKTYRDMVMDSDVDRRKENGETISGLYFAFVPAHHSLAFDEYGIPNSEENRKALLANRKAYEDNPAQYTIECRQYPMTVDEYFYADANKCLFNVRILQEARNRCYENPNIVAGVDFIWEGGEEFGKVMTIPGDTCKITEIIKDPNARNLVVDRGERMGMYRYMPINDSKYCAGLDPIQHKIISGDTGRKSKPIMFIKKRYDEALDGETSALIRAQRMVDKYEYKSGIPVMRYDYRPNDPVIFYEHILKICWYYGVKVLVEKQYGAALITYFESKGCAMFLMVRPDFTRTSPRYNQETVGIDASVGNTQLFTGMMSHDIEYYGHRYPFRELIDDLLRFNPYDTLEHDDSVAWGLTLVAEQDKVLEQKVLSIESGTFSRYRQFSKETHTFDD